MKIKLGRVILLVLFSSTGGTIRELRYAHVWVGNAWSSATFTSRHMDKVNKFSDSSWTRSRGGRITTVCQDSGHAHIWTLLIVFWVFVGVQNSGVDKTNPLTVLYRYSDGINGKRRDQDN